MPEPREQVQTTGILASVPYESKLNNCLDTDWTGKARTRKTVKSYQKQYAS